MLSPPLANNLGRALCSELLHCSSPLHDHVVRARERPAGRCRSCSAAKRCLTGIRIGVSAAMAACVMFSGGVAATLAFSNPRRLCIQVNVRHLVARIVRRHGCFEDVSLSCKECQGS